jgi:hypothetical protein
VNIIAECVTLLSFPNVLLLQDPDSAETQTLRRLEGVCMIVEFSIQRIKIAGKTSFKPYDMNAVI